MSVRAALIGALGAALLLGSVWLYGQAQYRNGRVDCEEAQRVAGLEEFKQEAIRLTGLSSELQQRIDALAEAKPKVIERYTREIVQSPLPADCLLDAGRLRNINAGVSAANSARESGAAMSTSADPAN